MNKLDADIASTLTTIERDSINIRLSNMAVNDVLLFGHTFANGTVLSRTYEVSKRLNRDYTTTKVKQGTLCRRTR